MHTFRNENADNYVVGFYQIINGRAHWTPMFHRVSFTSAIKIVNMLNGGDSIPPADLRVLELCQYIPPLPRGDDDYQWLK